jgi:hypothetical protein
MARYGRSANGLVPQFAVLAAACALTLTSATHGWGDEEVREFSVTIKNRPAGRYRMTINSQNGGVVTMTGEANVEFKQFLLRYKYFYRGTETWQNGRLVQLDSSSNDDGKAFTVSASAQQNSLRVVVNGRPHNTRPDVWTTTYWKLADPKFRNQAVPLIDADTGRDIEAQMRYVGANLITVAGQQLNCSHYQLSGGNLQIDLWYDAQERLVREQSVEQGQIMLLELQSIR